MNEETETEPVGKNHPIALMRNALRARTLPRYVGMPYRTNRADRRRDAAYRRTAEFRQDARKKAAYAVCAFFRGVRWSL